MKEYSFEQFESIGTVFVDEAHHICARVFSQSLFKMCPRHIYGLSATPDRKDGLTKVLTWFMGPIFFSIERENQKQVEVFPVQFDCRAFREPPPQPVNKRTESSVDNSIAWTRNPNLRSLYIVCIFYSHYLRLFNLRTNAKIELGFWLFFCT
jgi:hypothetical protein